MWLSYRGAGQADIGQSPFGAALGGQFQEFLELLFGHANMPVLHGRSVHFIGSLVLRVESGGEISGVNGVVLGDGGDFDVLAARLDGDDPGLGSPGISRPEISEPSQHLHLSV